MSIDDVKTTWVVQQADVEPRTFLSADGTWGTVSMAQQFDSEAEAAATPSPEGTVGLPLRMTHHTHRGSESFSGVAGR